MLRTTFHITTQGAFPLKNDTQKKKRFRLFDLTKDGRGISKQAPGSPPGTLRYFFRCLRNNFGKLVSVNIFFILGNFPLIFAIAALSGYTQTPRMLPTSDLFQNLLGIFTAEGVYTPASMSLFAVEGMQYQTLVPTTMTYVFYGISLITLFTFGLVNVGTAYILRNMAKGEPLFVWTDFWYAVRRNKKQGFFFGIADALVCGLLIYNIYSTLTMQGGFGLDILFWAYVVFFLLYSIMRFYIYVQMVTFDLPIRKILKNALYLSLLGIRRNLLAVVGILLLLLLELLLIFSVGGVLISIAVAMPLAILFSLMAFMKVYASYYKIKQYMIDPYLAEHPEEAEDTYDETPIMRDDVTERERLKQIKKEHGISDTE